MPELTVMPGPTVLDSPELNHFLMLATDRSSLSEAALSANVAASELGYAVLDNIAFLDETALRGLVMFIGLAKAAPQTARELLED